MTILKGKNIYSDSTKIYCLGVCSMKLTRKLADRIIFEVAGEEAVPVMEYIYDDIDVSEYSIAKGYDGDINMARNVLYRLHNTNLVTFKKKKDKTKGWYVYYWTLNKKRIVEIAAKLNETRMESLNSRLQREKDHLFYVCSNNCVRFDFDRATDYGFKCPECSAILMEDDKSKTINMIEQELEKLKKQITA